MSQTTAPKQAEPQVNPLEEASLDEIFSASPITRTDEEMLRIVRYYRDLRETWQKAELQKVPKAKKASAPKLKPATKELTIEDLGLLLSASPEN